MRHFLPQTRTHWDMQLVHTVVTSWGHDRTLYSVANETLCHLPLPRTQYNNICLFIEKIQMVQQLYTCYSMLKIELRILILKIDLGYRYIQL